MKAENEIELLTKIQRLEISEKYWRKILESMSEMVTIHDKEFGLVYANPQALKRFGKTLEELRGRKCHEIYHNRREPLEFCPHLRAIKTGEPTIQEVVEPYLGGIFLISCSPIFDDEGNVTSTVHMVRDITEYKKVEEALKRSEKKYRDLVDNALVGVYSTNLKGEVLYVNESALRM
ncbi:MAG: PAS domain-containing protein, partial [Candidatus Methanofastidiosia archaeon]